MDSTGTHTYIYRHTNVHTLPYMILILKINKPGKELTNLTSYTVL